jgi:predicted metalloprotease with PDZ domain
MIDYHISYQNPNTHIIDIEVTVNGIKEDKLYINLPSWRPGRYELANYAKNVLRLRAYDLDGEELPCKKITKDQWEINSERNQTIKIKYNYYAFQMDAGNSWLDDEQLYINPINCLVFIKNRMYERCFLNIDIPASYRIATGLKEISRCKFVAKDYFELSDCPLFASASLKCLKYEIDEIDFYIWIQGESYLNEAKLIEDFRLFSECQIKMMGNFPEKEYHFMFQFLPYAFRHGVEHRNSTVITIGPAHLIPTTLYQDLLGISAHELFHSWNVLKIRPKELMPYDFTRENYYETGYMTEGFTTYYGDLILARSGGFTIEQYFSELDDLFKRHFENEGNLNLSLAESSFDLWLDGYVPGTPNRKVSIYTKGSVVAFLMDISIRKHSENKYSLDDVMKRLWMDYGKKEKGIDEQALVQIIADMGIDIKPLIQKAVYECGYLKKEILEALEYLGIEIKREVFQNRLESAYGIRCISSNNRWTVDHLSSDSPAAKALSKGDEIISVNGNKFEPSLPIEDKEISVEFFRGKRFLSHKIRRDNKSYFPNYYLSFAASPTTNQLTNFNLWLHKTS